MGDMQCSLLIVRSVKCCPDQSGLRVPNHSDNFEVAIQLPIADMAAILALLPFTAGGEVLDEGIAEQLPRGLGRLQALCRVPTGARKGQLFGMFHSIASG